MEDVRINAGTIARKKQAENSCVPKTQKNEFRVIDFHAHILPGTDHGSDSIETGLSQLSMIEGAGTETVVATPHFYPQEHRIDSFISRREQSFQKLTAAYRGGVRVIPAAEVLVCEGMENMTGLERLCIDGTGVILLEMPMGEWSGRILETVENIRKSGLTPVMAHIDRYAVRQAEELLARGFSAQINAGAVCSFVQRNRCVRWIAGDGVVAVGSDLHGAAKNGYADFVHAQRILGKCFPLLMRKTEKLLRIASNINTL